MTAASDSRPVRWPFALAGLATLALFGFHLMQPGERAAAGAAADPQPRRIAAAESAIAAEPTSPPLVVETSSLGRGKTLGAALASIGLAPATLQRSVAALGGEVDLRKLPAECGIAVSRDARGTVRRLGLRAETARFVRVELVDSDDEPSVELVELPVIRRVATAVGSVSSSVDQALSGTPHGPRLTLAFADVFQWDVDLLVEPRSGDTVRVVYETLELGEPPADLPPFGDRVERAGDNLGLGRILAASYEGRIASSSAYWVDHDDGRGAYYDDEGAPLRKTFLKSPLNYRRISSGFSRNRRHPITRRVVPHHGVDYAAAPGTPVVAAADGRVASAGWDGPLGRAVRIRHGSEYVTVYGHLQSFARGVRNGVEVRQNQVIGYVGSTGRATGPHLHYTLIERGRAVDPIRFDNPPSEPLSPEFLPRLEAARRDWSPVLAALARSASNLAGLPPATAGSRGPGV